MIFEHFAITELSVYGNYNTLQDIYIYYCHKTFDLDITVIRSR